MADEIPYDPRKIAPGAPWLEKYGKSERTRPLVSEMPGYITWGKKRVVNSAEELLQHFHDYTEYMVDNPIETHKVGFHEGVQVDGYEKRARPWTMNGFRNWIGIGHGQGWANLKKRHRGAVEIIESAVYQQKFEGAAAGIFSASIMQRDLQLADRKQIEVSDGAAKAAEVDDKHIANKPHPDCTEEMMCAMQDAGVAIPMYSQAQIDSGIPFHMPQLPNMIDSAVVEDAQVIHPEDLGE